MLHIGRSTAGGEDQQAGGRVVFQILVAEELRAIEPEMCKVAGPQLVVHQRDELRDSGTLRC
jgi:hypothetical protein